MAIDLSYLKPPQEGDINVVALTADTASSAIDLLGSNEMKSAKITISCDEDAFYMFSKDHSGTVTDPDPTATDGDGPCWSLPRFTDRTFQVGSRNRYIKVISASTTNFRWRVED
jgi:hypothetical protein